MSTRRVLVAVVAASALGVTPLVASAVTADDAPRRASLAPLHTPRSDAVAGLYIVRTTDTRDPRLSLNSAADRAERLGASVEARLSNLSMYTARLTSSQVEQVRSDAATAYVQQVSVVYAEGPGALSPQQTPTRPPRPTFPGMPGQPGPGQPAPTFPGQPAPTFPGQPAPTVPPTSQPTSTAQPGQPGQPPIPTRPPAGKPTPTATTSPPPFTPPAPVGPGTQSGAPWGLDRIDQRALPLTQSYTYAATGKGVTAYVMDSGIYPDHNEYKGRVAGGVSYVPDFRGTGDCMGHGTHLAGTIGGSKYGVAKDVTLVPLRIFDCGGRDDSANNLKVMDWLMSYLRLPSVINMSFIGSIQENKALEEALMKVQAKGAVLVAAAGNNSGVDACTKSPSYIPSALTVGATDKSDARAKYSNLGKCLDLFAPGSDITSAGRDNPNATATQSGTSMAAPHVSGAVALYLEKHPTATPKEVHDAIVAQATDGAVKNVPADTTSKLLYIGQ